MNRKVLIAYEDTPQGRDAVALGRFFAESLEATPVLASVFSFPRGVMANRELETAIAILSRRLFEIPLDGLAQLRPETRAVVDQSVGMGLIELTDAEAPELVVVGSSHRGALGRTLLGSTAESLLHGICAAVAVAPLGYGERMRPHPARIGIAYDGSPESRSALETGIALAQRLRSQLRIFTVADYVHLGYAAEISILTEGELRDAQQTEKRKGLEEALASFPEGVESSAELLVGKAGPELARASNELDLLITGSRGYGALRRTILGSTTRRLLTDAACPVLVLPRGAPTDPLALSGGRGES